MQRSDSKWRQGGVLNEEDAKKLNLINVSESDRLPVVITHDCDLLHPNEEFIEVIVGKKIDKPNSVFKYARNPRCLHIQFTSPADQKPVYLELRFSNRKLVSKDDFSTLRQNQTVLDISEDDHRILKRWLAARYGRPVFPDTFERYLRLKKDGKTVVQEIAKILEPDQSFISGVFFDLGEHRKAELNEGDPYYLNIAIVYDDAYGGKIAREASEIVAQEIESLFFDVYGSAEDATTISLEACNAVAESYMSLSDLRKVDHWRLEYLSLEYGSSGNYLQTGEMLG